MMDTQEILFQKTLVDTITHVTPVTFDTRINDIAIITISDDLSKTCKRPVKITPDPKFVPLKITMPGPIPYKSNKTIPWNYGGENSTMVSSRLNQSKRILMMKPLI